MRDLVVGSNEVPRKRKGIKMKTTGRIEGSIKLMNCGHPPNLKGLTEYNQLMKFVTANNSPKIKN